MHALEGARAASMFCPLFLFVDSTEIWTPAPGSFPGSKIMINQAGQPDLRTSWWTNVFEILKLHTITSRHKYSAIGTHTSTRISITYTESTAVSLAFRHRLPVQRYSRGACRSILSWISYPHFFRVSTGFLTRLVYYTSHSPFWHLYPGIFRATIKTSHLVRSTYSFMSWCREGCRYVAWFFSRRTAYSLEGLIVPAPSGLGPQYQSPFDEWAVGN